MTAMDAKICEDDITIVLSFQALIFRRNGVFESPRLKFPCLPGDLGYKAIKIQTNAEAPQVFHAGSSRLAV
jgi:hypothetical protein